MAGRFAYYNCGSEGSMDAAGTFEQIIALQPHHEPLPRALRRLAVELQPNVVEVSRPGDRAVSWGWGPKKMSEAYACALPYSDYVNLAFYRGVALPDPAGMLKGSGKAMRHVSLSRPEEVDDPRIRELFAAARDERWEVLGKLA